jgi:hypothetical protein
MKSKDNPQDLGNMRGNFLRVAILPFVLPEKRPRTF